MAAPSFCFVHAADLHLDTPFLGVGKLAPAVAEALREASLSTFDAIVDLATEREAAFFLVAGDVYDGAERGLRAQLRFREGLARLSCAGTPSFVVHGNHDPVSSGWSAIARWPEGVTVFGTGEAEAVPVLRSGEIVATVQGVSYAERATTENLARRLRRPPGPGLHVGVLHCNVEGAGGAHSNYSPCTLADLRATGLDYLALGHVHEHRVLSGGPGEPWIVYPGNSQARSWRPGEVGPKGAVVVQVQEGRVAGVEQVACDQVRFSELSCDISGLEDLGGLEEVLLEEGRAALEAAGGRPLVARARLVGRGELHSGLARPGSCDELLASLRDQSPAGERFCWWDAIVDESRPLIDRRSLLGRGDFSAELAELALAAAGDREAARELLAGVGALPRSMAGALEEAIGDESSGLARLLDAAAEMALEALGEGR